MKTSSGSVMPSKSQSAVDQAPPRPRRAIRYATSYRSVNGAREIGNRSPSAFARPGGVPQDPVSADDPSRSPSGSPPGRGAASSRGNVGLKKFHASTPSIRPPPSVSATVGSEPKKKISTPSPKASASISGLTGSVTKPSAPATTSSPSGKKSRSVSVRRGSLPVATSAASDKVSPSVSPASGSVKRVSTSTPSESVSPSVSATAAFVPDTRNSNGSLRPSPSVSGGSGSDPMPPPRTATSSTYQPSKKLSTSSIVSKKNPMRTL